MYFLQVLTSLAILSVGNSVSYSNDGLNITSIAYSHCPVSRFCKSGMESPPPFGQSCCGQCSCEADCHIGQRCCPDLDVEQTSNVTLVCKTMDEHFDLHRNLRLGEQQRMTGSYYVIDNCTAEFKDDDVMSGCVVPRTLREHVFVSDPISSIIYKNYQCAICNGVVDYEFWDMKLVCIYTDSLLSPSDEEDTILRQCSVISEPNASLPSRTASWACNPKAIDTCNVTGEWDMLDDSLVEACATFNMMYTEETYGDYGEVFTEAIYKNIYCFMCNKKTGEARENAMCLFEEPFVVSDLFGVDYETRLAVNDISATESRKAPLTQCSIGDIVDPISGGCLKMFCPIGQIPVFGNCTSIMRDTNTTVTAIFEYTATSNDRPLGQHFISDQMVYDALMGTIKRLFALGNCAYCHIYVYPRAFVIQAIQNRACSNDILAEIFHHLTRISALHSNVVGEKFGVSIRVTARYSIDNDPHRVSIYGFKSVRQDVFGRCNFAVQVSPKFNCKRIKLSLPSLVSNGVSNGTIERILAMSEPDDYVNDKPMKYAICVDDYVAIANDGSRIDFYGICQFALPFASVVMHVFVYIQLIWKSV